MNPENWVGKSYMQTETSILFRPCPLGAIWLTNRIIMAPMTRSRANNPAHTATALMAEYYTQRASAGLIITEGIFISKAAAGYINVPGIYTREQTESWQQVTRQVHAAGGKIFAQLWHVGRISHPDFHQGNLPPAPSAINPDYKVYTPKGMRYTVTPGEMSIPEIKQTVLDFKRAAENALAAGFDGIELHAANGYLFHQFFASCANIRRDEYGGNVENRSRFLFEVLDALSDVVDYSRVGVRLNPGLDQSFGIIRDETTIPTFNYIIQGLNDYPLAYLHLTGFSREKIEQEGNANLLATVTHYRKLYQGTLMINKGFDSQSAARAISEGLADLVSFGIPFIGNPDLVKRYRENLPLNASNRKTFYTGGPEGYTDYPFYI